LLYQRYGPAPPFSVGLCFEAGDWRAKFLIDQTKTGDELLELLARNPKAQARSARPWGVKAWLVEV
jgi:hypothetical protein